MATISTTLELVDRMSGRLTAIAGRVQALSDRFMQLDGRIGSVQARMEALGLHGPELNIPEVQPGAIQMYAAGTAVPGRAVQTVLRERSPVAAGQAAASMPEAYGMQAEAAVQLSRDGAALLEGIAGQMQAQQGLLASIAGAAADAAVLAVQRAMQPSVGAAIGMRFTEGLAQGIRSRMAAVAAAARAVANAASSAARHALDIHSPSRAAEEIGAYFGAGFAEGICGSGQAVSRAAGRLSGIAYRALDEQIWSGISCFNALEQAQHEPGADRSCLRESDARRMRELAEREAVKTFTTAELNIAFTANNTIDSKMDLDGVVAYLEEQVAEKLALAAEGVYT